MTANSVILNDQIKTRIHKAVDILCHKLNEPHEIVNDFREEMTTNIMASVQELVQSGYSTEEAVAVAIERFGTPQNLVAELSELYRIRKVFAKGLLTVALLIGILGILCVSFYFIWNNALAPNGINRVSQQVQQNIMIGNDQNTISEGIKPVLQKSIDGNPYLMGVGIRVITSDSPSRSPFQYVYPQSVDWLEVNGIFLNDFGYFTYGVPTERVWEIPGTNKQLFTQFLERRCTPDDLKIGQSFLFLYWGLFAAWGIMNVYYNRNFKMRWAFLIIFFNVIGYLVYLNSTRRFRSIS